jgi:hypothetical protein
MKVVLASSTFYPFAFVLCFSLEFELKHPPAKTPTHFATIMVVSLHKVPVSTKWILATFHSKTPNLAA